jgi:ATP-dependent exoDNAse (exonuclease V) beta subunit
LTAKNKTLENIKPKLIRASSPIEEKTFVIEKVKKLLKSDKINPEDIAIICRSNKEVEDWTNFFAQNDFIVNSKKKTNILNNNYVEFLINFLEIIKEPFIDSEKLVNLLLTESIDFDNIDVLKINNYIYKKSFKDQKISFFEVISNESFLDEID